MVVSELGWMTAVLASFEHFRLRWTDMFVPFGGQDEALTDLKDKVFLGQTVKTLQPSPASARTGDSWGSWILTPQSGGEVAPPSMDSSLRWNDEFI